MTTNLPDPIIRNVDTALLMDAADNPNHMSAAEQRALTEFMRQKGFLGTILVRPLEVQGTACFRIIDGHHRVASARDLAMPQVPCTVVECDDHQEVLLRIAMNKLRGELDLTGVGRAFKELQSSGFDLTALELTGYTGSEISDLLSAVSQDVDAAMGKDFEAPPMDDYEVPEADDGGFELVIVFESAADKKKARTGLRKAAGKTKNMALGLLKLLGEEKST